MKDGIYVQIDGERLQLLLAAQGSEMAAILTPFIAECLIEHLLLALDQVRKAPARPHCGSDAEEGR